VNSLPKTASRLRFEPGPFCAGVQHANHSATEPPGMSSSVTCTKMAKTACGNVLPENFADRPTDTLITNHNNTRHAVLYSGQSNNVTVYLCRSRFRDCETIRIPVALLISKRTFRAHDAAVWRCMRSDDGGGRGLGLQHYRVVAAEQKFRTRSVSTD